MRASPPAAGLTWTQYLIWAHQRLYPRAPLYNVPFSFTFQGTIDPDQLAQAVQAAVNESESLRSVFVTGPDGQPVRQVAATLPVNLERVDLAAGADLSAWIGVRAARLFELDQPLFDTALITHGARLVWYFNAHHLVVDGASGRWLYERVRCHYEHLVNTGRLAAPQPDTLDDLLAAEAAYRAAPAYGAAAAYWEAQAANAAPPATLYVPPGGALAEADALPAHAQVFDLGTERTEALLAWLARVPAAGPNPNVALLNFWVGLMAVYAHRLSGVSAVSVAAPFANRRAHPTVIAPVMTEVPITVALDGGLTWRALVAQVAGASAAAHAQRHYPFQSVVSPLPALVVNVHNWAPCAPLAGVPVSLTLHYVRSTDKTLIAHLRPRHQSPSGSLTVELVASAARLSGDQLEQTAEHLRNLLDSALAEPEGTIAAARVAGRAVSVVRGGALPEPVPDVVSAFHRQVAAAPDRVAAVCGAARMSYGALAQRAAAVAEGLRAQGAGPGERVALWLPRSIDLPAALLGVWQAGAAYLPLDPSLPPARLAALLDAAQVTVALTARSLASQLPAGLPRLVLEDVPPTPAGAGPLPLPAPEQPAVIIYTSGSTGQPKGVLLTHAALAAHLAGAAATYGLCAADRVLQFAALSFDTATEQVFTTLTTGATLVMRGPEVWTPTELAAVCRAQGVTVANLPTAYWQQAAVAWAEQPGLAAGLALRLVLIGGEALPPAALERWRQVPALAGVQVLNVYGPTEAAVTALAADVTHAPLDAASLPIGRPLPGRLALVTDAYGAPQPLGAAGELCLGGVGLAAGYWRAPAQTEAAFVPGPHGRLYRTGDQAYVRPDGALVYLGRRDRQVKVRGVRIELAEIEAALADHPQVRAAVVRAAPQAGELTLTAYVASPVPAPELVPQLRDHLRARLPAAMLPAAYAVRPELPLTAHGKVDEAALAAWPAAAPAASAPAAEALPGSALEVTLLNLWREVLHRPALGRHDNFFDAGGHSLLAARLFARLETELGVRLPVATLAQAGSVAQLAEHLRSAQPDHAWPLLVRLTPSGSRPPLFCVHGFGGGVLGYLALARALGPEQPFYALAARGLDGNQAPDDEVPVMAARYVDVVRATQPHGPYYLAGYCFGGLVAYELAVQLTRQGEAVAFVGLFEGYPPGGGGPGGLPLGRAALAFARNLPYWAKDYVGLQIRRWRDRRGGPAAVGMARPDEAALAQVRHLQAQHDLALQRYVPPRYAGRVHLFRARGQALRRAFDPLRGWGALAAGGVRLHLLPGSHYNILEPPYVAAFAHQLAAALATSD